MSELPNDERADAARAPKSDDRAPEVSAIKREGSGWRLTRRDVLAPAGAESAEDGVTCAAMTSASVARMHATLPIFRLEREGRCVLYAPGHLAVVTTGAADRVARLLAHGDGDLPPDPLAAQLRRCAEEAVRSKQEQETAPFMPECLTVYLSNRCNSRCSYCFAAGMGREDGAQQGQLPPIREEPVLAAARIVARSCAKKEKPLDLVLHGGGEPTLHWDLILRLESLTRQVAEEAGIAWRGYVATGGVLEADKARWLAAHFDRIGLSCDGPPDIQDRQRPLAGGKPSSAVVAATAAILAEEARWWAVRATITPQTVCRQAEIVRYLCRALGAKQVRLEPVFGVRAPGCGGFLPCDAPVFVEHFLAAEQEARSLGCDLGFSGVRLDEVHGPYCNLLRQVLHLTPDGAATACFFAVDSRTPEVAPLAVGSWDPASGEFLLDEKRIAALRRRAAQVPGRCRDCVNQYHCARECPEACWLGEPVPERERPAGFRCLVARQLAERWILTAAESAPSAEPSALGRRAANGASPEVTALLDDAPPPVDVAAIVRDWEAVQRRLVLGSRAPPPPVWARRGFEHGGPQTWRQLTRDLAGARHDGPISVYVHVPLCNRRCPFCDCYSLPMDRDRRREAQYVDCLLEEIEAWSGAGSLAQRPITTIHFGGGTPNCLRPERLAAVVRRLGQNLAVTSRTEWALESTSSLLGDDDLQQLRQLGFTRLHVGVQTLEEPVRRLLGRREPAERVEAKLVRAIGAGFVVSVDLIYGLPGQTLPGLVTTLQRLVEAGVHGVSLYQLQTSPRNRPFLQRHGAADRDPLRDYVLFQTADQFLKRSGYRKNHFSHYALPEDANLYYTHALRREDLLALGPTADGVFGAYHYRHPELDAYVARTSRVMPALQGGVWESELERRLRPASAALMTGSVSAAAMRGVGAARLLDVWLDDGLLEEGDRPGQVTLTGNGSWLLSQMLDELADHARRHPPPLEIPGSEP